ncbi:MAG: hypothetical protein ACRDQA_18625 [Nocardioidaceae bacterium]
MPSNQKKAYLVTQYRQTLRRAGFGASLTFKMVDEGGHDLHLVFGTTHPVGLDRMKDAMWKVDPIYGVRYRDPRDPHQQLLDIADPDTGPLRRDLLAQLGGGPRSVESLRDYASLETVYRREHVIPVVRGLLREAVLERTPPDGRLTKLSTVRLTSRAS